MLDRFDVAIFEGVAVFCGIFFLKFADFASNLFNGLPSLGDPNAAFLVVLHLHSLGDGFSGLSFALCNFLLRRTGSFRPPPLGRAQKAAKWPLLPSASRRGAALTLSARRALTGHDRFAPLSGVTLAGRPSTSPAMWVAQRSSAAFFSGA
jgi:hypothetical protein